MMNHILSNFGFHFLLYIVTSARTFAGVTNFSHVDSTQLDGRSRRWSERELTNVTKTQIVESVAETQPPVAEDTRRIA